MQLCLFSALSLCLRCNWIDNPAPAEPQRAQSFAESLTASLRYATGILTPQNMREYFAAIDRLLLKAASSDLLNAVLFRPGLGADN
jgi:hypothetical protein